MERADEGARTRAATETTPVPILLKWGKQSFSSNDYPSLVLIPSTSTLTFQKYIESITGVPISRQKLLCKHAWKGILPHDENATFTFVAKPPSSSLSKQKIKPWVVTLIGSTDKIPSQSTSSSSSSASPRKEKTKFIEDMTQEELQQIQKEQTIKDLKEAEGLIIPLQLPPSDRRDNNENDRKKQGEEMYKYNRLVTGLPQYQIETLLSSSRNNNKDNLLGKVVMTMGLELRRAYVNDMTALKDGTLVSVLDDGHVQMWKHCQLDKDLIHNGSPASAGTGGGVDCITSLDIGLSSFSLFNEENTQNETGLPAFATGGKGCIQLWTINGDAIGSMASPPGTTPTSLVSTFIPWNTKTASSSNDNDNDTCDNNTDGVCIMAATLKSTYNPNPNRFRLVPQNEAERLRRNQEEALDLAFRLRLRQNLNCVHVWVWRKERNGTNVDCNDGDGNGSAVIRYIRLEPPQPTPAQADHQSADDSARPLPIVTSLAILPTSIATNNEHILTLVCGDDMGGLRFWNGKITQQPQQQQQNDDTVQWKQSSLLQLCPLAKEEEKGGSNIINFSSIECMEPLADHFLAVSIKQNTNTNQQQQQQDEEHDNNTSVPHNHHSDAKKIEVLYATAVYILNTQKHTITSILRGHKDVVQKMCLLPNNDLVTAGGKYDATLQVWNASMLNIVTAKEMQQCNQGVNEKVEDKNDVQQLQQLEHKEKTKGDIDEASSLSSSSTTTTTTTDINHDETSKVIQTESSSSSKALDEVGYVFALTVLKDFKPGSNHFALAAARYNVVKICL